MNAMEKARLTLVGLGALLLAAANMDAFGAPNPEDDLQVKINAVSPSIESLSEGGSPLAVDTYSSSASIKVNYNLTAQSFTSGTFGSFKVGLAIEDKGTKTTYPLTVMLDQEGSGQNLQLTANPSSFNVDVNGDFVGSTESEISMVIDCSSGCPTDDGSKITANLQFSADPTNAQLKTGVKVQVNITLVIPQTESCLNLYNFLTDQSLVEPALSTEVVYVKNGKNVGKVNSTTPFGQFSDNIMVANTCAETERFDLLVTLDPSFDTNPHDNPGNAVFTYLATQIVDPETFNIDDFSDQTPQGQMLCLQNIELAGESSFLATVHMGVNRGIQYTELDPDGDFNFKAELFEAGTGCGLGSVMPADSEEAVLPYTLK